MAHPTESGAFHWHHSAAVPLLLSTDSTSSESNKVTYNAAISACARGRQWKRALELLEEMRVSDDIEPDAISYNAAISACGKVGKWGRALELLQEMRRGGIEPDVIACNAADLCTQQANAARVRVTVLAPPHARPKSRKFSP